MDTKQLIEHFGSLSEAARKMEVSRQSVYTWLREGLPGIRQEQAERVTAGALKAEKTALDELMDRAA